MKNKEKDYKKIFTEMWVEWKWLFGYIRKYWWSILIYIAIGVIGTLMGLGSGVASKYLIDAVISYEKSALVTAACMVIGLAVLQIFMNAGASRISSIVGSRIQKELQESLYSHMVNAQWEDIHSHHSGDLLNRLNGDIDAVYSAITSFLPSVITRIFQFAGALCIVLYYDKTMAVIALLGSPVVALTSRFMMRRIRRFSKESRELQSEIYSYSSESLQSLQTVKAFGLTRQFTDSFKVLLDRYRNVRVSYDKFAILMTMCLSFLGLIVSYSCYGWGVWRLWKGVITYGTMTLFLQMSGTLSSAFNSLVALAPSAVSIATSAGRVKEITALDVEESEPLDREFVEKAEKEGVSVNCDGVSFCYKDGQDSVLFDVDFYVNPGETIALIGPSGQGKTTMLRVLLGLLKPEGGSLTMRLTDGESRPISPSTRMLCGFVPQGGSLFTGTIEENMRMVKPDASEDEIIEALKTADAWEFVSELPDGVGTKTGEKGVNFSEGQGQRLAIARAVLRDAPVLLLDESTSALDIRTESRVLEMLMKSSSRRACILTTHRLSMLRYCDRIYRLNENRKMELVTLTELEKEAE